MRKETWKKLMATAVSATMAVSMLAGCGSTASTATASSAAPASSAAASEAPASTAASTAAASDSAASGAPVEISIYRDSFNVASPDSAEVQAVQDAINDYIKDKINVQIKLTDIGSGEYKDKANLALTNNEINLLWTASWQETINTDNLVKQNAVYDISSLLPDTSIRPNYPRQQCIPAHQHHIPVKGSDLV